MRGLHWIWLCLAHAYVAHGFLRFNCYIGSTDEIASMNLTALTNKCTHVSYAYADIDEGRIAHVNETLDSYNLKALSDLKKTSATKILIAVPGYGKAYRMSAMSRTQDSRQIFIESVLEFIKKFQLDGVLIDWRYPLVDIEAQAIDRTQDKENFASLVKEMRTQLGSKLVIGVTVGASNWVIHKHRPYDEEVLDQNVDFVDILTHSYHGFWEPTAGHHAPLGPLADSNLTYHTTDNIMWAVKKWSESALSPKKMNVILTAFGYLQNLKDEDNPKPLSATSGGEFRPYSQICKLKWSDVWFPGLDAPVAILDSQWISYDNARSLKLKLDYLQSQNIGGISFDSIDKDDWNGECGQPLVSYVAQEIVLTNEELVESSMLFYWIVGVIIVFLLLVVLYFGYRRCSASLRG
ncbi:Acidic mammalian chitinase [Halotydeus destructor]|nr:Acidic mammalian chitinase [Halotydeus destructor]